MTDADVIDAIRRCHLKANIDDFERDPSSDVQWDRATIDVGGTPIFGNGPYLHVPVVTTEDECVVRVYPPARLRRRLAKRWVRR
jgi:hypothetical protein